MRNNWENENVGDQDCWYALHCKPNFEFIVFSQLEERQIQTYFPLLHVRPVNPRSKTRKPFFPGYMFVKGDLGELYVRRLGLLRGVGGLVSFDGVPAPLSDSVIEIVRRHAQRENSKMDCDPASFKPGERVWIDDPALRGIEARFEQCLNGEDRVIVLLSLLGRTVRVQTEVSKLKRRAY